MPLGKAIERLGWSPRDAVGVVVGVLAVVAVLINVLFMQSQPHPAPMFKPAEADSKSKPRPDRTLIPSMPPTTAPPARRADLLPALPKAAAPARAPGQIIGDIQRELSRRGYYDGSIDGFYGPKTDAAIRDFEQAYALKPSSEPSETLLQAIIRSPAKAAKGTTGSTTRLPARNDIVAERAPVSPRILAVQRALSEYGYGQIKANGTFDLDTQRAIEKFERERKLPVTGQVSDRLLRELTEMTGRPLD